MTVLLIAIGAALGAPLRYLTDRAVQARHDSPFPWGTLTVNVIGSLVLGAATAAPASPAVAALVGTGFCGALTTWSTLSYETLRLSREGARFHALANMSVSLVAGLGAAALGYTLTSTVTG
ncbi:fluoride efflux transporter CrcB [Micromonospora yasonensis]|uniref:fluoride efflux transporter CrcB n=1 Tax=Micromonospora yasonensis TaxID=1128667 RepID=UPI0022316E18|nr:fluoride efflux transporter CrcB [Micromonospora yasonensis]MCW3844256.1 fluoride efflux transporter CrcB [Micromonospora yasonensis]